MAQGLTKCIHVLKRLAVHSLLNVAWHHVRMKDIDLEDFKLFKKLQL